MLIFGDFFFFKIDQGSLAIPRTILLNQNDHPKVMAAYTAYVSGAAKAVRDSISGGANDGQIESDTRDLIRFEFELAKVCFLIRKSK